MSNYINGLYKKVAELVDENSTMMHLAMGICNRKLHDAITKKTEEVEKDFVSKANYYKKNVNELANEKAQLLKKFQDEFNKVYDVYSNKCFQYLILKEQIDTTRVSTIGNIITLLDLKDKVEESQEYIAYITKRKELEDKLATIEVKEDYDKTYEVLNSLEDPKMQYDDQLARYIEKYGNLCGLVDKIQEIVDSVSDEGVNAIASISVIENAVVNETENNILAKIKALISGIIKKGNFETGYLLKATNRAESIDTEISQIAKKVEENSINVISIILDHKDKINKAFAAE